MDPISNMLVQLKNAQMAGHKTASIPYSNLKFALLEILKNEEFVGAVNKEGRGTKKKIEVVLKYNGKNSKPAIEAIKRVSKSGQRIYMDKSKLSKLLKDKGVYILSTSQGLMTAKDAKKAGIGGEVLCRTW